MEKIQILCKLILLHQQKRKRKPNVGNITNRNCHLPQLPAIQALMRNHRMISLKLPLKMKNWNWNYPKVSQTTQTNILNSTFQRIAYKRLYYVKTHSQITLIMSRSQTTLRGILKEKLKTNKKNIEKVLEKLQCKTVGVMGPLSKLWNILEGAKGVEEDAVQISIIDLHHYVEQTVLLLRQSCNAITCHRRLNVPGSFKRKGVNSAKTWRTFVRKKGSRTTLLTPSNPINKPRRYLRNTKSIFD